MAEGESTGQQVYKNRCSVPTDAQSLCLDVPLLAEIDPTATAWFYRMPEHVVSRC